MCLERYLNYFNRPITYLEISSEIEHITSLAQKNKESTFILWSSNNIINPTYLDNMIHLSELLTKDTIQRFSECEHIDIAFINSEQQKIPRSWVTVIACLAEHVFIQVNYDSILQDELRAVGFETIEKKQSKVMYYKANKITFLKRTQWLEPASNGNAVREIISSYDTKFFLKKYIKDPKPIPWKSGINFMTFKMLKGIYPRSDQLCSEVLKMYNIPHLDWMPNNMVVQGKNLTLIDMDNSNYEAKTVRTDIMLELMILFAKEIKPDNIRYLFNLIIFYCRIMVHPEYMTYNRSLSKLAIGY
ncbi:MAG: hypothetical protein WDZ41_00120 [Candidatus Babeliales bacterium]